MKKLTTKTLVSTVAALFMGALIMSGCEGTNADDPKEDSPADPPKEDPKDPGTDPPADDPKEDN